MRKHKLTTIQRRILRQIPEGIERPVKIADIVRITRINERTVNRVIRQLTAKGIPVVSFRIGENKGVFIALNEYERELGLVSYTHQKNEMERRINDVRNADLKHWKSKIS